MNKVVQISRQEADEAVPAEEDAVSQPAKAKGRPARQQFTPEELALAQAYIDVEPQRIDIVVSDINIDFSYQTRIRERIQAAIKNNFHAGMLQTLKISRRPDGTLWAIDGATRVLGLRDRGDMNRKLHCEVWDTPGRDIEAVLFYIFHDKSSYEPMKIETRAQAQHVAGLDHGFVQAIEECGFSLIGGGRGHFIRGVTHMQQTWDLDHDGTAMRKALFSVKDAWRDLHKITGYLVKGVALLYRLVDRRLDEQVRKVLRRLSPEDIDELVKKRWLRVGGKRLMHPAERPPTITHIIAEEINRHPGKGGKIDLVKLRNDLGDRY